LQRGRADKGKKNGLQTQAEAKKKVNTGHEDRLRRSMIIKKKKSNKRTGREEKSTVVFSLTGLGKAFGTCASAKGETL